MAPEWRPHVHVNMCPIFPTSGARLLLLGVKCDLTEPSAGQCTPLQKAWDLGEANLCLCCPAENCPGGHMKVYSCAGTRVLLLRGTAMGYLIHCEYSRWARLPAPWRIWCAAAARRPRVMSRATRDVD